MAQRQFRSDDTSPWGDRFGSGSGGAYSPSTGTDNPTRTTCTGSVGGTALTVGSSTGFSTGDLLLIHQTQGTGAGNWEFNKISNISGFALAYNLTNTYVSGAQVMKITPYSSATISGGVTISGASWDGSTGGIYVILCNGSISVAGTISANGIGYRGGSGYPGGDATGQQGESGTAVGGRTNTANGMGGGGGENKPGLSAKTGGGGGSYGTSGVNGTGENGGTSAVGGTAGSTGGVANLTTLFPGGAGGQGGVSTATSYGGGNGNSGGIVILVGRTVTITGSIVINGSNGLASGGSLGGGGAGSGGACLIKGQTITLGTTLISATGGTGGTGSEHPGGAGGSGRIHADYAVSISGTTSPTIDTTKDTSFLDSGGSFIFNMI